MNMIIQISQDLNRNRRWWYFSQSAPRFGQLSATSSGKH